MAPVKKGKQPHQLKKETESDIKEVNNNSAAGCEKIPSWTPPTIFQLKSKEDGEHVYKFDAGTSQQQTSISSVTIKTRDNYSSENTESDVLTPKLRARRGRPKRINTPQPLVIGSESSNDTTSITTDSILKFIKPPPKCSYITRSLLKKLKTSKLINVTNDDSELTRERTKCTSMYEENLVRKSPNSKLVATSSEASIDSKDFNFASLKVMDSKPKMAKLNSKRKCNRKDRTSWRKSQKLQPSDKLDTANEDILIVSQLGNNFISRTEVCKTTCTYECRGKLSDHSNDSLSDGTNKVDSISTSMKSQIELIYQETNKLQSNLVRSETVNISIIPESQSKINVSKPQAVKCRSKKAVDKQKTYGSLVVNQNSSVGSVDLSSTSCIESDSTLHVLTAKVKRTRQPKKRVRKNLRKSKQLERATILTCQVENTYPTTGTTSDSTSGTSKSDDVMVKYLPKPVVRRQKMQISSNEEETGEVENTYQATGTISDSTSDTSKSEIVMAECLPKPVVRHPKMQISDKEETDKVENTYPATGTLSDSTSDTSKSEIVMAKCLPKPVVRHPKMRISSSEEETGKVENTYPATETISDSTSDTLKSEIVMAKCLPKPVVRHPKMRISSNDEETVKVENTYPATGTISDSTSETWKSEIVLAKCLPKSIFRRPNLGISSNDEETGKLENTYPATETISDSTSEISKSEIMMAECLPKSVVRHEEKQISSNQDEMGDTHVLEIGHVSLDRFLATDAVSKKMPNLNNQMTHKCQAAKKQMNSQTPKTNGKTLREIEFTPSENNTNFAVTINPSTPKRTRTRKRTRVQKNLMNSTVEEMEYHPVIEAESSVYESGRRRCSAEHNTKDTNKNECVSTKCKEQLNLISDVVKIEDLLHSNLYQPRVLLHDIAYDKELPQKHRDMLLRKSTSRDVVKLKNLLNSTTTPNTKQSIKCDNSGVSSKSCNENDQSLTSLDTNLSAHKHKCSNLQEQDLQKPFLLMHPGPIESVRGRKSSSTVSDTDFLSSLIVYPLNRQKVSLSTGLPLEPCSPTKINHTEINLMEPIMTHQEDNLTEPIFKIEDIQLPLDLRVNASITSVKNEVDFLLCNDNSVKIGSSNFNLTNNIDEHNDEKIMLSHSNLQAAENIQLRCTDSICNPNRTPVKSEKLNLSNGLSVKVSIPIYFTDTNSGQMVKVIEHEKLAPANESETHSSLKLLETHQLNGNETVELISDEKCNITSNLTEDHKSADEDNNNHDNIGLTTTLDLINIEDDNGSCFAGALKNSSADIFSLPYNQVAARPIQQSTPIRKKWPKIVKDEILPKGTIRLPSRKCVSLELFEADTKDRTHLNDVDDISRNQELLIAFNGHSVEQDGNNDIQSEHSRRKQGTDQIPSTGAQPFDDSKLLDYCPELATLLSPHNSTKNNNSEIMLSDTDFFNDNSRMNNNAMSVPRAVKTETSVDNVDLSLNDNVRISRSKNEIANTFRGVVASSVDYADSKIDAESSKVINTESTRKPSPVIAELTIANLRNFTKISNTTAKSELTWCFETHQYYSLHKDDEKCKLLSEVNELPDNHNDFSEATKSELENQTQSLPVKTKQRKRKWISDNSNKDQDPAPFSGNRIQLKRNRWSVSGPQDLESTINFHKSNLAKSNASSVSSGSSTGVENKQSSKNSSSSKKLVVPRNNEIQQLDLKTENLMANINILPTSFDKTNIDNNSEASKYAFCEDNILPNWSLTSAKDTEGCNCNSDFDKDRNLTNSVLASPLSSRNSVTNIQGLDRFTPSKEIDGQNPGKGDIGLTKDQSTNGRTKEDLDYEYDDCISLFAESIVITNVDQSLNFMDDPKRSPCDTKNSSEKTYEDIKNFGAYYKKNLEECNAAYELGLETEGNGCTTSNIIVPSTTENNNNCLNFNDNSLNTVPVPQMNAQYSESKFSSAINPPISNLNSSSNMRDRLGIKQETRNVVSTFTPRIFCAHCFHFLKFGFCRRKKCKFVHNLTSSLQNLDQKDLDYIIEVIGYSEIHGYTHFTNNIYRQLVTRMDARNILELFYKLYSTRQLNEHLVNCTVQALIETGMSLQTIVSDTALLLDENDVDLVEYLIDFISDMIQPGTYWNTFRDLLIKITPSERTIIRVIHELFETNKDKSHIEDVYINFINKLRPNQVSMMNINLRNRLHFILMKNDIIQRNNQHSNTLFYTQNDSSNRMLQTNVCRDINRERIEIPSILSPDSTQYSDNGLLIPQTSQRPSLQGPVNTQSLFISRDDSPKSITADPNVVNQKRDTEIRSNPPDVQFSATSSIKTTKSEAADLTSDSYKVHLIDDLKEPQSVYRNRHWQFHLDMTIIQESLKHQDYEGVLKILNKYSDAVERTLFTTSCYRMLHKNVMMSAHHMKNMIKLSVRMGVNKSLSQTLFNLGMYTMIELCDAGAWVIAYSLFKPLQATGLMENIAEYALISAEIYIANGRPLKAFTILKQSNMFYTNRSKWLVTSNPNDERLRVMILSLLLDVLCQDLPEQAFYIFTYLLGDQSRIYHPIDLTAYTDKLVTSILNGKCNELVPEVARTIIEYNFSLSNSVFQSLVINLFKKDLKRCKQLYRYGTWLGVYPIVRLTVPLCILIKTNWAREEIYLAVVSFLEKLCMDIGHAVDQIRPNQFSIHLVFELTPFEHQLLDNEDQVCNSDELNRSKKLMKTVLQEEFNPPLKTMYKERERFMKLQSRTVVNYLKSMNALQ
ncbi:serine-rich adhesin for platelets-like [Diprion similis]|uniref:serine-rich adhesin for platelets-like n=1 Tax=Diprion similis TaxID=362088 RepID=UPI001EF7CA4B|nr:serine-rich adhesin for platelets-like [Diprion similis]